MVTLLLGINNSSATMFVPVYYTVVRDLKLPVKDPVGPFLAVRCCHLDVVVSVAFHEGRGDVAFQQNFSGLAAMTPDERFHFAVGEVS